VQCQLQALDEKVLYPVDRQVDINPPLAQTRSVDRRFQIPELRITRCWIDNFLISGSLGRSLDLLPSPYFWGSSNGITLFYVNI